MRTGTKAIVDRDPITGLVRVWIRQGRYVVDGGQQLHLIGEGTTTDTVTPTYRFSDEDWEAIVDAIGLLRPVEKLESTRDRVPREAHELLAGEGRGRARPARQAPPPRGEAHGPRVNVAI